MTVELITGHAGAAHISSADAGWYNAGTVGDGKYVMNTGAQLEATVQSANLVTIGVGDAVFEGRHVRVSAVENVALDNGAQDMKRNDIICIRYAYDSTLDVESASIVVLKGTASSGTAVDPDIPSGSILEGASTAYMPLWRIPISGITVGTPEKMYGNVLVTLNGLLSKTWTASQIPNISADKITSGTLATARIPSLDASKIDSGTFAAARIPALAASKITSGTFDAARIPSLAASKIGSGTLDVARIPDLDAGKITSGTLSVSRGGTGKTDGTCYMATRVYYYASGTKDDITLSETAANFSMLEIYYRDNDSHYSSTKVYAPNGKTANLSMVVNKTNGQCNYKRREVDISGTSIATQSYGEQDGTASATSTNNIYIYAVFGYK